MSDRARGSTWGAAALALALVGGGGTARADEAGEGPGPRSAALATLARGRPEQGFGDEGAAWLDVGLTSGPWGGGEVTLLATEFGVRVGLGPEARAALSWGVAWASPRVRGSFVTPTTETPYDATVERVEARNPELSVEWVPYVGSDARFGLGLAFAAPSAALASFGTALNGGPTSAEEAAIVDASRVTHAAWVALNGGLGSYRYQPDRLALAVPLTLALDAGPVRVDVEATGAVSVAVLGGEGGVEGALAGALDVHGPLADAVELGARASVAGLRLGGASADAMPAVEPWLTVHLAPCTATLRGLVGLTTNGLGTLGASPEPTPVWSVHLSVAAALTSADD